MPTTQEVTTMSFRDRLRGNNLFLEAVSQSDLKPRQKLFLRLAYRAPDIQNDVDQYIEDLAVAKGGDINAMANGDLLKLILDNLPEIAAFIATLFKLFGGI